MLERQREGIARAKREGRYKGRVPTVRRKAPDRLPVPVEGPIDSGGSGVTSRLAASEANRFVRASQ
jgi:DNA invertase Pin-like site-specific DNA recombinase